MNRGQDIRTISLYLLLALITTFFASGPRESAKREVDNDKITHTPTSNVPSMFSKT